MADPEYSYDRSASWFESFKRYVQETNVSTLDLSNMQLKTEEAVTILQILADSQVSELDLSRNNFTNQMEFLSGLLVKTKIRKLNISSCDLEEPDILSVMSVLKDLQITDLDISENRFNFYKHDDNKFVPFLLQSHLTALNIEKCVHFGNKEEALLFFQALPDSSLTHLNLVDVLSPLDLSDTLLSLLSILKHTSVTHLNLSNNSIGCYLKSRNLGDSLRNSKLVELDLSGNHIDDQDINVLFEALIGTRVTTLNLARNSFKGANNLGSLVKKTEIRILDLSDNYIYEAQMFAFPHFLKDSSVVALKLHKCYLPEEIGQELMESLKFSKLVDLDISGNYAGYGIFGNFVLNVKHTEITHFDFSKNCLYYDDDIGAAAFISFGQLLVDSKLQHIDINQGFYGLERQPIVFAEFLEGIKNSSVTSLNMCWPGLDSIGAEIISPSLTNSPLTHLDLSCNLIGDGILSLAVNLKFTAITHLNLENCSINNTGVETLSGCLMKTQITDLNLSRNLITSFGAIALAISLKDANISSLKLNRNSIESDGLEILAEHTDTTLITVLEVNGNPGNRLAVEEVIWNNRRLVHQVLGLFKQISPERDDNCLRFEVIASANATNVAPFLEECLSFYKVICERPSAYGVLARDKNVSLSKDRIITLLLDEFPKQFTSFIVNKVEADVWAHIRLLKRAEELGLNTIIKLLLLHRPVYTIDESRGVLHPFMYKLLNKYKFPICNLGVEPQGIERIINYFTEFPNIEGATNVISMLKDKSQVATKDD